MKATEGCVQFTNEARRRRQMRDEGEPGPEGRVNNGDVGLEAVGWGRISGEGEARGIVRQ